MTFATDVDDTLLPTPPYEACTLTLSDAGNNAPWSGLPFSFRTESITQSGELSRPDTGTAGEAEEESATWFQLTRRARDRWLRENPY